jgi:hypothetical protein
VFRPAAPAAPCCIVVQRGSQAFEERHIQLANIADGLGSLEVTGYPDQNAPGASGVSATCPTRTPLQGIACGGADSNLLPSFGSDEIPVDVLPAQVNVVNVDVHSLPFLLDLDPGDGETAEDLRPHVNFTVVDAAHAIHPDVNIRIKDLAVTDHPEILTALECQDGDSELPDCSSGGALEVRGLRITSEATQNLPQGTAELRIQASNTASTPQSMESNTTFVVQGSPPTTTTSTTIETTTTTLEPVTYCLKFSVSNAVDLVGISYSVDYAASGGDFTGSGENVSCFSLLDDPDSLTSFNDDDGANTLSTAIISANTFSGPIALAQCEFRQVPPFVPGNLPIQVTEATDPDLAPASATVIVEETQCPL